MKRPSFQFYPADWRNNAKLRRCSEAARGAWIDVLCLMHDSDEYGVLRWPLVDIARASGVPIKLLKELADREVLKGGDKGCDAFIHTPIHARKKGEPITLLEKTSGPCWYSSRFLTDEWRRSVSGGDTKFKSPKDSPSHGKVKGEVKEKDAPIDSPDSRQGAGATSTSTSSNTVVSNSASNTTVPSVTPAASACIAIREVYDLHNKPPTDISPANPTLAALIEAGATVDEFRHSAIAAMQHNPPKGFAWILGKVRGQRQDAANISGMHQGAMPANAKEAGIQIAAKSIFKPENISHLTGAQEIEVQDATKHIAA